MSLKYTLDTLDGVDDSIKTMYAEKDGKFVLAIDGLPQQEDVSGLKSKVDQLLAEKKEAANKAREADEQARLAREEAARKSGDTEALEKSWQEKFDKATGELKSQYEPRVNELESMLKNATVKTEATRLASELAVQGSSRALMPHIESRLQMQIKDGKASTIVLGLDGKPSALTIEELKNEFIGDAAFAPLIVGSKASGGGANESNGGAGTSKILNRSTFESKTPIEQKAFMQEGGKVSD